MATAVTDAQAALINSFTQDDIPIKLRCAICSKLAVNAFRLPCCDQASCETCQSTLSNACPVCEHEPVAADDCKPHKTLRTTIRIFLRTAEKKRETLRPREPAAEVKDESPARESGAAPAVTKDVHPTSGQEKQDADDAGADQAEETSRDAGPSPEHESRDAERPHDTERSNDIDKPSDAENPKDTEPKDTEPKDTEPNDTEPKDIEPKDIEPKDIEPKDIEPKDPEEPKNAESESIPAFPGMGFTDLNQMQMMMAMQNGMHPGFGPFPVMGMGMDSMAMQNMYMNGGFGAQGGIGMNGMNMGMGFGGFDGWNGQQSWNVGQDNFNPSAGIGHGDFGAHNSGYHQQNAGYHQGNYGAHPYNDYQQHGYGASFRGRGRLRGRSFGHAVNSMEPEADDANDPAIDAHDEPARESTGATSSAPLNAPTGPKAMREGLPNTSLLLMNRGRSNGLPAPQPSRSPSADDKQSPSRSASRSRSRSRDDRRERHRKHRQRSASASDDGRDDERRRARRRRRERRYRDDDEASDRSASRDSKRRRRREDDRRPDRDHKHRRSRRSRRDRSYERDSSRSRSRSRRHRRRRTSASPEGRAEELESAPIPDRPRAMMNAPSSLELAFEIKGSATRRHSHRDRDRDETSERRRTSPKPTVDPLSAEREKRDRERLLKETQRIAGLARLVGGVKRGRETEDSGRSKSRVKHRHRSERED